MAKPLVIVSRAGLGTYLVAALWGAVTMVSLTCCAKGMAMCYVPFPAVLVVWPTSVLLEAFGLSPGVKHPWWLIPLTNALLGGIFGMWFAAFGRGRWWR